MLLVNHPHYCRRGLQGMVFVWLKALQCLAFSNGPLSEKHLSACPEVSILRCRFRLLKSESLFNQLSTSFSVEYLSLVFQILSGLLVVHWDGRPAGREMWGAVRSHPTRHADIPAGSCVDDLSDIRGAWSGSRKIWEPARFLPAPDHLKDQCRYK